MLTRILFILSFTSSIAYSQDFGWTKTNSGNTSVADNIATDSDGNTYVFGSFYDTIDVDPSANIAQMYTTGFFSESYLAKYDPAGNYLWSKKLNQVKAEMQSNRRTNFLELDSQGNLLIAVNFEDSLIDLDGNVHYSSGNAPDIGVLKVDGDGNQLWIRLANSPTFESIFSIQIDNQDNILLSGGFTGNLDVDFGAGTELITSMGEWKNFVLKLNAAGDFEWVRTWDVGMEIKGLSVDNSGNVWMTGGFNQTIDFDPSAGTYTIQNTANSEQGFILKLDSNANFLWANSFFSTIFMDAGEMDLNQQNEAVISGSFQENIHFGSTTLLASPNSMSSYLVKINAAGTIQWTRQLESNYSAQISELKALSNGTILLSGTFMDTLTLNAPNASMRLTTQNGVTQTYCAWYTVSGDLKWTAGFEGDGFVYLTDIAEGSGDTVILSGNHMGTCDFDLSPTVDTRVSLTNYRAFLKKMYFNFWTTAGIDEVHELEIHYTNPITDQLIYTTDTKIEKVSVFSADGSLIKEITDPAGKVDFQGMDSGLYLVHFYTPKGTLTSRIVRL